MEKQHSTTSQRYRSLIKCFSFLYIFDCGLLSNFQEWKIPFIDLMDSIDLMEFISLMDIIDLINFIDFFAHVLHGATCSIVTVPYRKKRTLKLF